MAKHKDGGGLNLTGGFPHSAGAIDSEAAKCLPKGMTTHDQYGSPAVQKNHDPAANPSGGGGAPPTGGSRKIKY